MNCPICEKKGIDDESPYCPQCNTELTPFFLIKKVRNKQSDLENINKESKKKVESYKTKYNTFLVISLLLFVCFIVLCTWNCWGVNNEKPNTSNAETNSSSINIDSLKGLLLQKDKSIDILNDSISSIKNETYKSDVFMYVVKRRDNLSKIASFFFGDGNAYHKIMEDNQLENSVISKGDTLQLKLN